LFLDNHSKPEQSASSPGTTKRWVMERTNSWSNAHKKLVWCTERKGPVIDFWIAFSNVVLIVGRLVREAWSRYRWQSRDLLADHKTYWRGLLGSI
jgi:hypothetical protein